MVRVKVLVCITPDSEKCQRGQAGGAEEESLGRDQWPQSWEEGDGWESGEILCQELWFPLMFILLP